MTFLDLMVHKLADGYQHFEGTCCLFFLGGVTTQTTITFTFPFVIISKPSWDF
jgi:hypothetical protein